MEVTTIYQSVNTKDLVYRTHIDVVGLLCIRFTFGNGNHVDVSLNSCDDEIVVRGSHILKVHPNAVNSINVGIEKWKEVILPAASNLARGIDAELQLAHTECAGCDALLKELQNE